MGPTKDPLYMVFYCSEDPPWVPSLIMIFLICIISDPMTDKKTMGMLHLSA